MYVYGFILRKQSTKHTALAQSITDTQAQNIIPIQSRLPVNGIYYIFSILFMVKYENKIVSLFYAEREYTVRKLINMSNVFY